jgi:HK97 family phage major capsid protein
MDLNAYLDLSKDDLKKYSFRNLILSQIPGSNVHGDFERECSLTIEKKLNRASMGRFVPADILLAKRDFDKGSGGSGGFGGYAIQTDLLAASFIDILRAKTLVRQLGATILPGLRGDVLIPKLAASANVEWVGEGDAATESFPTLGQIPMEPHSVTGYVDFSRKLLLQATPAAEGLIRMDLAALIAQAVDLGAINGSGSEHQPLGIIPSGGAGEGDVPIVSIADPDGGVPTYAKIVEMESTVANANADVGALAYLTNSKVAGILKLIQRFENTDSPIWVGNSNKPGWGIVNGYNAGVSNNVPSDLAKGGGTDLSAIIFGDWSSLIIGEWGILDILVNTYTLSHNGATRVVIFQDIDIALRHKKSFCIIVDAVTTLE